MEEIFISSYDRLRVEALALDEALQRLIKLEEGQSSIEKRIYELRDTLSLYWKLQLVTISMVAGLLLSMILFLAKLCFGL